MILIADYRYQLATLMRGITSSPTLTTFTRGRVGEAKQKKKQKIRHVDDIYLGI